MLPLRFEEETVIFPWTVEVENSKDIRIESNSSSNLSDNLFLMRVMRQASNRSIVPPRIMHNYGVFVGMRTGRRNWSTRIRPVSVPLSLPQIPSNLMWNWTRAATVGNRWLIPRAMMTEPPHWMTPLFCGRPKFLLSLSPCVGLTGNCSRTVNFYL
jgi:hypothetical protein